MQHIQTTEIETYKIELFVKIGHDFQSLTTFT